MQTALAGFDRVSVARAKERLRIDGTDEDEDLEASIAAAVKKFEHETGRVMCTSSWELRGSCWPAVIALPLAPVRDVSEVAYLDIDGAEQALAADEWYWRRTPAGAQIRWTDDFTSPSLLDRTESVIVRFTAGYDESGVSGGSDEPELAPDPRDELAILFLVGHWHRMREPVATLAVAEVPESFRALADQRRIYR